MKIFTYAGIYSSSNNKIPIDVQHLIIDESVDALPEEVCRMRQQLLQVDLSSHLTQIGDRAFDGCTSLKQVVFGNNHHLLSIGEYSFHQCFALLEVSLPHGLHRIGIHCFSSCRALKRINLPSSVKKIDNSAFSKCHALEQVILMKGLVHIGEYAFFECYALREIKLPETVETIGSSAFSRCRNLINLGLPTRYQLFSYTFSACPSLTEVEIPSSMGDLPDGVFTGCSSLTNVKLHEGLKRIGANAFSEAFTLVTIQLPSTTTTIRSGAFAGCTSLAEVDIPSKGGLTTILSHAFLGCVSLKRFRVPFKVTKIDQFAFSACKNLVSVEFSPTRTGPLEIGNSAFGNCKSLMNIEVSFETETISIHLDAFDGCDMLDAKFGDAISKALSDRFAQFPIHKKCYHSSDTNLEELRPELDHHQAEWNDGTISDSFGMTPFHVLLSAATSRLDLLECLLETYPVQVLDCRDDSGKYAIDYLSTVWNEETKSLMLSYLQKWLVHRLEFWGKDDWRSDMAQKVNNILADEDRESRDILLKDAYGTMKKYERVETMALLELAIWKKGMVSSGANEAPLSAGTDREAHRARCGASFVVPNVIAFLDNVPSS